MELAPYTSRFPCVTKLRPREPQLLTNPKGTFPKLKKSALNLDTRSLHSKRSKSSLVVSAREGGGPEAGTATAVVTEKPMLGRFRVSQGYPAPFGATARDGGVNFAIYSANAVSATLCLISLSDLQDVSFIFLFLIFYYLASSLSWYAVLLVKTFHIAMYQIKKSGPAIGVIYSVIESYYNCTEFIVLLLRKHFDAPL